jgi:GNAT superfamily N-acetyltransferase
MGPAAVPRARSAIGRPPSPEGVIIRPLAEGDRSGWEPLWESYLTFYETRLAPAVTAVTFTRLTCGSEPMGGFVAQAHGALIGMAHWITHRSCWTEGDYCYLQDLFVEPRHRDAGIGTALIEAVCVKARALGCSRVHWLTRDTNRAAMRLYQRLGERSGFIQYRRIFANAGVPVKPDSTPERAASPPPQRPARDPC